LRDHPHGAAGDRRARSHDQQTDVGPVAPSSRALRTRTHTHTTTHARTHAHTLARTHTHTPTQNLKRTGTHTRTHPRWLSVPQRGPKHTHARPAKLTHTRVRCK
jgi:hypothetical protein